MTRERQARQESGIQIPAYIVTFSDMVTLLLTFFVMLLSLAQVQDPELVNKGRDSFLKSINQLGLGMLFGEIEKPNLGGVKIKYFISNPDKLLKGRTIDARQEDIRQIFKKVSRSMKTMPSQIVSKRTNFSVTDIRFSQGDATLNEAAKRFLTKFYLDLEQSQQTLDSKHGMLYVLGLAGDEATEKKQWMLSARRAQAAADFLQSIRPSGTNWPVYSWGAGPGGDWVDEDSPISKQSHILIAVLRAND